MLIHTSGSYSLDIKVTEKVLSTALNNNFYDLTSTGLILYKLEFPTGDFAIEHSLKSTLACNIKTSASTTIVFDLCFISSADFNKSNPLDIDLTDIVDTISYTNNSTNTKEDVITFDLTKKLSSIDLSTNRYFYLAIRVDNSVQIEKFFVDEDRNDKFVIAETSFEGLNNL
ncbi:MAG: hypothetical protein SOV26_04450, partial [Candidatus Onthovivens sp.]|nr:hypothetical protein [Candidatus Onthovivens sp.]